DNSNPTTNTNPDNSKSQQSSTPQNCPKGSTRDLNGNCQSQSQTENSQQQQQQPQTQTCPDGSQPNPDGSCSSSQSNNKQPLGPECTTNPNDPACQQQPNKQQ